MAVQSGKSFEVISSQYNIPINKVCEYAEKTKEGYRIYVLCQVAKAGNMFADFDYGFNGCYDAKGYKDGSALLLSALLPGSGQMSKRRYGEGILTLTAEVGLGITAMYAYINAEYCRLDIEDGTSNNSTMERLKTMETLEYASIGTAVALYVFNLYRAYTVKPKYKNRLALFPTAFPISSDMAYGVCVSYKF